MPKVLNKRTDKIPADAVYVGRPSKWGNPFVMHCEEDRDLVCDQYEMHFNMRQLKAKPEDLHELKGKDLVCWCSPLRCHAHYLLTAANADSN
jgi:hypothetical protein